MVEITKEWIKYLKTLEKIDERITNSGLSEDLWYLQMSYEAEKAGIPNELIDMYVDGNLAILNGKPYDIETGKEIKIA